MVSTPAQSNKFEARRGKSNSKKNKDKNMKRGQTRTFDGIETLGLGECSQNVPEVGPRVIGTPGGEHPQDGVPLLLILPRLLLSMVLHGQKVQALQHGVSLVG